MAVFRKMTQIPQDIITIISAISGGNASFGAGFWWQYTAETGKSFIKYFLCAATIIISDVMVGGKALCSRASAMKLSKSNLLMRSVRWAVYYAAGVMLWVLMFQEAPSQFIYFQF